MFISIFWRHNKIKSRKAIKSIWLEHKQGFYWANSLKLYIFTFYSSDFPTFFALPSFLVNSLLCIFNNVDIWQTVPLLPVCVECKWSLTKVKYWWSQASNGILFPKLFWLTVRKKMIKKNCWKYFFNLFLEVSQI